ncbi:GAF domain-containing protein [Rubripirellula amarantea]|nr:GAF domain-containing protein [Rubripirellula amarantea]
MDEVRTYDVIDAKIADNDSTTLSFLAEKSAQSGAAEIYCQPKGEGDHHPTISSAIAVPVHRGGQVFSVAVIALKPVSFGAGVFELWEPIGPYEEVALRGGYFAHLERFSNVSSFIRFERGSGLPGQAWASGQAVIHDDLPNHPGFLRAAGASAGLLETAIALPVLDDDVLMTIVVLISSKATPIARGYEVWNVLADKFVMEGAAYQGLDASLQLPRDTELSLNAGLPGLALEHGGATISTNAQALLAGRQCDEGTDVSETINGGLAIPTYKGETLSSVTTLMF